MQADRKRAIFDHFRKSLITAGLQTTDNESAICPLCWQEVGYSELSLEHIVPRKVGGRALTLTCATCNNSHGSDLDAHLSKFQTVKDAQRGYGTVPTELNVNGNRMVANLQLKDGNFIVVGKTTDPKAVSAIKDDFAAGNVSEVKFTMFYEYAKDNFNTAVLRAAYLSLFDRLGYEYVKHEVIQAIRRRICDLSLAQPNLDYLIVGLGEMKMPFEAPYYIIRRKIGDIDCLLVIIRVRKATTTYLGSWMPNTPASIDQFETLMQSHRQMGDRQTIKIAGGDFLI